MVKYEALMDDYFCQMLLIMFDFLKSYETQ